LLVISNSLSYSEFFVSSESLVCNNNRCNLVLNRAIGCNGLLGSSSGSRIPTPIASGGSVWARQALSLRHIPTNASQFDHCSFCSNSDHPCSIDVDTHQHPWRSMCLYWFPQPGCQSDQGCWFVWQLVDFSNRLNNKRSLKRSPGSTANQSSLACSL